MTDAISQDLRCAARGRRSTLVVLAWILALAPPVAVADDTSLPTKNELRKKSSKELKSILASKGARCKKCVEKDDIVAKVIETWDWPPIEVQSPDGKVKMDKETFKRQLEMSYEAHIKEAKKKQSDEHGSGHQRYENVDKASIKEQMPDFDKVWADFAKRLANGDIPTDKDGQLRYDVGDSSAFGAGQSWWDQYKIHAMMVANLGMMWIMHRLRRSAKEEDNVGDAGASKAELNDSTRVTAPGSATLDIDD